MILLFLFGVKKKKLTKRKNTGFRFEAAPEQLSSEAQELASLKQPALLFAEIHSYTFRLKTKAGFFISSRNRALFVGFGNQSTRPAVMIAME